MSFKDVKKCLESFPEETQEKALLVVLDFISNFNRGLNRQQCVEILNKLDAIEVGFNDLIGILILTNPDTLNFTINRFKTNFNLR